MSAICSYIYTTGGFRFESGSGVVKVTIDGVERALRVVRNGNGSSRIDKGEITLSDLESFVDENGVIEATFDLDGTFVSLPLDPKMAMGDKGRSLIRDIESVSRGLSPDQRLALAKSQLQSLPYGTKNSEESRARLLWALEQGDLGSVSSDVLSNIAAFLDGDALAAVFENQPALATDLVFGLSSATCDPDLLASISPQAREALAASGVVLPSGVVPMFEAAGLDKDDIVDMHAAGAVFDKTYGALIGDVPLETWLLSRESLVSASGVPWSLATSVVRDSGGNRVKDAVKLEKGAVVTVTPKWAASMKDKGASFARTEVVSGVGLTSDVSPSYSGVYSAVWRSQGGTLDVYSRLPGSVLRSAVSALSDDELSEALAWSSPRDFDALAYHARTDRHREIIEARYDYEIRSDRFVVGNALWNDTVDEGLSQRLGKTAADSVRARESLSGVLRTKCLELDGLWQQLSRVSTADQLRDLERQVVRLASTLRDPSEGVVRSANLVSATSSLREQWLNESLESVHHDPALYARVRTEMAVASDAARIESLGMFEATNAVEYARDQLKKAAESAAAGDRDPCKSRVAKALESLKQATHEVSRSANSSKGIDDAMDYTSEDRRATQRAHDIRDERLRAVASTLHPTATLVQSFAAGQNLGTWGSTGAGTAAALAVSHGTLAALGAMWWKKAWTHRVGFNAAARRAL